MIFSEECRTINQNKAATPIESMTIKQISKNITTEIVKEGRSASVFSPKTLDGSESSENRRQRPESCGILRYAKMTMSLFPVAWLLTEQSRIKLERTHPHNSMIHFIQALYLFNIHPL